MPFNSGTVSLSKDGFQGLFGQNQEYTNSSGFLKIEPYQSSDAGAEHPAIMPREVPSDLSIKRQSQRLRKGTIGSFGRLQDYSKMRVKIKKPLLQSMREEQVKGSGPFGKAAQASPKVKRLREHGRITKKDWDKDHIERQKITN